MTLLEEVIELDTMLANDGYKSWGYARLTLDKVIKALQAPPDVNPHVMQAEGSDVSEGAAVGQRSGDTATCGVDDNGWNCKRTTEPGGVASQCMNGCVLAGSSCEG